MAKMKIKVHEKNTPKDELIADVKAFLEKNLKSAISDDYRSSIIGELTDDVVADVEETSAFGDDGSWNTDDIRLAVGRVLSDRLGI